MGKINLYVKFVLITLGNLVFYSYVSSVVITENDAVDIALKNNLELKVAAENLRIAEAKLYEGFSGFLPKVNAGASYTKLSAPQFNVPESMRSLFGGSVSPALVADNLFGFSFSVSQPIFMWGKVINIYSQTKINYLIQKEKFRQIRNDVIYKAKESFYKALLANEMVKIALESKTLAEKRYRTTEKLFTQGKASSYDVSRAKVALTNTQVLLLKSENGLNLAKEALRNFLSIADNEELNIVGSFNYVEKSYKLEDIVTISVSNRPEVKIAELQESVLRKTVSLAKTENKPNIIAMYNYTLQTPDISYGFSSWDKRWQASISIQLPLFDGLASYSRIKQAELNLQQIKYVNSSMIEYLKMEAKSAYLNYEQSVRSLEAQKENITAAKQNLQIAERRYDLGLISYLELQDVHFAFSQAQTNYQQALYDYNIAVAVIEKILAK